MSELCKKCAACCQNYPFIELSQTEIRSLEQITGDSFQVFTNQHFEEVVKYFLQFQENGYCCFLHEENGRFFCGVYEARPRICKEYPSNAPQQDACDAHCKKLQISAAFDEQFQHITPKNTLPHGV